VGVGIALGLQRSASDQKVYAVVGDGELNEGQIWEGALFAAHHKINNLMLIVDMNGFQAMGATDDVLSLGDLRAKLESFGFAVRVVDGHDEQAIHTTVRQLWRSDLRKPKALIAKTVKGKGVPFMEGNNRWHYTRLNEETFAEAVSALGISQESR